MSIIGKIPYITNIKNEAVGKKLQSFAASRIKDALKNDALDFTTNYSFFNKFKNELKNLVTDKNGNFIYRKADKTQLLEISPYQKKLFDSYIVNPDGKIYIEKVVKKGKQLKLNIDKEFSEFKDDLGVLIHETSEKNYNKILKEGFKKSNNIAETFDGIYFTRLADGKNTYGDKKIKCLLNGKIATGDTNKLSDFIHSQTVIDDILKEKNFKNISAVEIKQLLLKEEFQKRGFKGVLSSNTDNLGKCVVFEPNDIKILKNNTNTTKKELIQKTKLLTDNYQPAVFKGSDVPMHHDIYGLGEDIRIASKYENKKFPTTKSEWDRKAYEIGKKEIKIIDEAFSKLKPLEKDCIVYKGLSENPVLKRLNTAFHLINKAKIGDIVMPDRGYSYTAFKESLAKVWGGNNARCSNKRVMMYKILLPKGSVVSRNLEHGGEAIIPRNAKYKLLEKNVAPNGDISVTMEYIIPKK